MVVDPYAAEAVEASTTMDGFDNDGDEEEYGVDDAEADRLVAEGSVLQAV